jgi:hypothetical protein
VEEKSSRFLLLLCCVCVCVFVFLSPRLSLLHDQIMMTGHTHAHTHAAHPLTHPSQV